MFTIIGEFRLFPILSQRPKLLGAKQTNLKCENNLDDKTVKDTFLTDKYGFTFVNDPHNFDGYNRVPRWEHFEKRGSDLYYFAWGRHNSGDHLFSW